MLGKKPLIIFQKWFLPSGCLLHSSAPGNRDYISLCCEVSDDIFTPSVIIMVVKTQVEKKNHCRKFTSRSLKMLLFVSGIKWLFRCWAPLTPSFSLLVFTFVFAIKNLLSFCLNWGWKSLKSLECNCVFQMAPDYDHLTLMEKVEVFEHAVNNTAGDDLAKLLWLKSPSSEVRYSTSQLC